VSGKVAKYSAPLRVAKYLLKKTSKLDFQHSRRAQQVYLKQLKGVSLSAQNLLALRDLLTACDPPESKDWRLVKGAVDRFALGFSDRLKVTRYRQVQGIRGQAGRPPGELPSRPV
jgi:hypothetical protein